jgi:hypothetical protein
MDGIQALRGSESLSLKIEYILVVCEFVCPPRNHFGDINNYSISGRVADYNFLNYKT